MLHVIKKQTIYAKIGSKFDQFHTQQLISNYYKKILLSTLENTFDNLSPEGGVIYIDKLVIDIGEIDIKTLEENKRSEKIEKILQETLSKFIKSGDKQLVRKKTVDLNVFEQWLFYLKKGYLPWNTLKSVDSIVESIPVVLRKNEKHINELQELILVNNIVVKRLIYQHSENFLVKIIELFIKKQLTGLPEIIEQLFILLKYLQTTTKKKHVTDKQTFKDSIWSSIIVQSAMETEISSTYLIRQFTYSGLIYYNQTLLSFPPQRTAKQLSLILPEIKKYIGDKKKERSTFPKPALPFREVFEHFFKGTEIGTTADSEIPGKIKISGDSHESDKITDKKEIIHRDEKVIKAESIFQDKKNTLSEDMPIKEVESHDPKITSTVDEESTEKVSKTVNKKVVKDKESIERTKVHDSIGRESTKSLTDELEKTEVESSDSTDSLTIDEEDIFVQHAGLVLLHPFLVNFFTRLKLLRDKEFVSKKAREKALFILYYLATGEHAHEEYMLVIPKILCEFPLEEPVKSEYKLTKKEIHESNEMLQAVLAQWAIFKKTTTSTLQQEFLQRNGKLFKKEDKLQLLVEAGSFDAVLDYLPWNLSIIKLPWRKEILWVEWR